MPKRDIRIDKYIKDDAPWARPILRHIRKIVHLACPKAEEDIKWGMPTFMYNGKILCGMAAFKAHCALWFWEGKAVTGSSAGAKGAMGNFGRIMSLKDLPSATVLKRYVKKAMKMNDAAQVKTKKKNAR